MAEVKSENVRRDGFSYCKSESDARALPAHSVQCPRCAYCIDRATLIFAFRAKLLKTVDRQNVRCPACGQTVRVTRTWEPAYCVDVVQLMNADGD